MWTRWTPHSSPATSTCWPSSAHSRPTSSSRPTTLTGAPRAQHGSPLALAYSPAAHAHEGPLCGVRSTRIMCGRQSLSRNLRVLMSACASAGPM